MSSRIDPFVAKDTGIKLGIRKVSPLLLLRLRDRYPAPKPPFQMVDLGDGARRQEPNPAHPDYIAAVEAHDIAMERRIREMLIRRGVVVDWTDEAKADLAELKEWWQATHDETLEGDDAVLYVSYVALGSDSDLEELINALVRRSQPTEEAVEETLERFPN